MELSRPLSSNSIIFKNPKEKDVSVGPTSPILARNPLDPSSSENNLEAGLNASPLSSIIIKPAQSKNLFNLGKDTLQSNLSKYEELRIKNES